MNIVLDTNVIVSGLLSPFGPCGEIASMVSSGELRLCFDARILAEYREVLRRPKFGFDQEKVAALLEQIDSCGRLTAPSPLQAKLPDADDEPFLEVAAASSAASIVTGNPAHFPSKLCRGVLVLSPSEFLRRYRQKRKGRN